VLNPLLEPAETIHNQLWIPGNRVLLNLNLQSKFFHFLGHPIITGHPKQGEFTRAV